jgi:antitoxin component YwqK of YwqJK toxin-antitoxin module
MHGSWSFYRKDGTIMRSGAFKAGRQIGNWVTYDSSGKPYKTTAMG